MSSNLEFKSVFKNVPFVKDGRIFVDDLRTIEWYTDLNDCSPVPPSAKNSSTKGNEYLRSTFSKIPEPTFSAYHFTAGVITSRNTFKRLITTFKKKVVNKFQESEVIFIDSGVRFHRARLRSYCRKHGHKTTKRIENATLVISDMRLTREIHRSFNHGIVDKFDLVGFAALREDYRYAYYYAQGGVKIYVDQQDYRNNYNGGISLNPYRSSGLFFRSILGRTELKKILTHEKTIRIAKRIMPLSTLLHYIHTEKIENKERLETLLSAVASDVEQTRSVSANAITSLNKQYLSVLIAARYFIPSTWALNHENEMREQRYGGTKTGFLGKVECAVINRAVENFRDRVAERGNDLPENKGKFYDIMNRMRGDTMKPFVVQFFGFYIAMCHYLKPSETLPKELIKECLPEILESVNQMTGGRPLSTLLKDKEFTIVAKDGRSKDRQIDLSVQCMFFEKFCTLHGIKYTYDTITLPE